jgi:hypothetical protein
MAQTNKTNSYHLNKFLVLNEKVKAELKENRHLVPIFFALHDGYPYNLNIKNNGFLEAYKESEKTNSQKQKKFIIFLNFGE